MVQFAPEIAVSWRHDTEAPSPYPKAIRGGACISEIGDEVFLPSGKSRPSIVDLQFKRRGMDFIGLRRYCLPHGPDSTQGNRWVFSLVSQPDWRHTSWNSCGDPVRRGIASGWCN